MKNNNSLPIAIYIKTLNLDCMDDLTVSSLNERIGANLKRLRRKNKLTQFELSSLSGIGHIGQIESGASTAGKEILVKLANALKVDVIEFYLPIDAKTLEILETDIPISPQEEKVLEVFRCLSPPAKKMLFAQLLALEKLAEENNLD